MRKGFLFLVIAACSWVGAYEVDNFTERYSPLPDSRAEMNKETNRRLALAVQRANSSRYPSCNPKIIQEAINNQLGALVVGTMEDYADKSPRISRHKEPKESIYSNRTTWEKLKSLNVMTLVGLNSSVNLNGHYVGADKFGHFFDEGLDYYMISKHAASYSAGVSAALDLGTEQEETYFGLQTTGVKSYGDMSANYSGFLFWTQVTEGPQPYFKCVNNHWAQNRSFDWADYVSASWDEAINCSEYANDGLTNGVKRQSGVLETRARAAGKNRRYTCPVAPSECKKMRALYGAKAKKLLGPACYNASGDGAEEQSSGQKPSGISGNKNWTPGSTETTAEAK